MKPLGIQTPYHDINKHPFPQVMLFFILYAETLFSFPLKLSVLKLYCPFLRHFLDKSHKQGLWRSPSTQGKQAFLTQKPKEPTIAGLQFAKAICFWQSHITAIK